MINVATIGSWALVDLAGEFDLDNAEGIRSVAVELVDQGATDVSVDLSRVRFMGAAGLNALQAANHAVESADARLIIVGASPFARQLFTITGLDRTLPLADRPMGGDVSVSGRRIPAVVAPYCGPGRDASGRLGVRPVGQSLTEPTITENLQRIARQAEQDVPGCRAASICLLAHAEPRTVAVSNAVAIQIDVAQYNVNEGPCLEAARTSETVRVDLLGPDQPFTRFAPLARRGGIRAVLSVPLITQTHTIGTLNLYFASAFDPTAEAAAATIANQAAAFSESADRHRRPSPPQQVQAKAPTPPSPRRPRERSELNVVDLAGLEDSQRRDRLRSLNLLDAAPRPNLDRLVRLACDLLETPIGLLSLIDTDRQLFLAAYGLPQPLAAARQTGLHYSICQYPATTGRPLIVGDTRAHPVLAAHLAVTAMGVRAYAGIPMVDRQGYPFGTCCVIDVAARHWDDGQLATLARLANIAAEVCLCDPGGSGFEEARHVASATP